jgi:hypothetical protein
MTISDAIKAKLLTIAPDASAMMIIAAILDIRQSGYYSADISLARLTAIYNGVSGLANPAPAEPVAPDAFDEQALDAYYQQRDALEDIVNLSIDSEACAGCGALPGDGYTAGCWHSTGCGYLRELEQRLAERDQ